MKTLRTVHDPSPTELDDAFELRRRVFTVEQGVDPRIERDLLDETALHVVLMDGARAVATGRMILLGAAVKLQRIAVDGSLRRRGLGRQVMDALEGRARALGCTEVRLASQVSALPFYVGLGYMIVGEPFVEAGIDHRWMKKPL